MVRFRLVNEFLDVLSDDDGYLEASMFPPDLKIDLADLRSQTVGPALKPLCDSCTEGAGPENLQELSALVCGLVDEEASITLPDQVVTDLRLLKIALAPATTWGDYKNAMDKLNVLSSDDGYVGVLRFVFDSAQWNKIQEASSQKFGKAGIAEALNDLMTKVTQFNAPIYSRDAKDHVCKCR